MIMMTGLVEQLTILKRGADQITPTEEFHKKLERSITTGKPLRVKYGIDPTGIDVHLGHTVPLRKLRQFQMLGHQAVLIIGNYTALVGDPSGRDQTRAKLTKEQVELNAVDYLKQVGKIIDISQAEVRYNGEWFGKNTFLDVLSLTSKITVQRMLERDDFTKRYKSGTPIYLHECLYPLMQGQDSVEIHTDIELGGTEQLFNLMMGRHLQSDAGQEPQVCLTLPILRGLDGERRMGKSLKNYIGVGEPAYEQFAKTMSIPDGLMAEWFKLLTDRPEEEVTQFITTNPMQAKKQLGRDIVGFYYGETEAAKAQTEWELRHTQRQDPTEIADLKVAASELQDGKLGVIRAMVLAGFAKSNGEAKRLVEGGGVTIGADKEKVADPQFKLTIPADGLLLRVGSRKIVRVKID
jgi:tyrosyl-tRNA synthetase